jgi:small GTP-binding protein
MEERRIVIPLMLLGDGQVGKTSLSLNLTKNTFDDSLLTTVGKESYIYQANLHGHNVKMKIWDTAGQERFKSMSVGVIKMVDGLILVYSIANKETFKNLDTWMNSVKNIADLSSKPVIILGNKCDLNENRQVTYEEGENYAKNLGYHFYETSAKTGENVKEAFDDIFEQLYKIYEEEIEGNKEFKKSETISLNSKHDKKKKCCK